MISTENLQIALEGAVAAAKLSPCAKSKRGVIIFAQTRTTPDSPIQILARGHNAPPEPFVCSGDQACRDACSKICVHAEMDALMVALRTGDPLFRYGKTHMLHVKVVGDRPTPSGAPSCWQCSRMILQSGVDYVWLLHDDGLKSYGAIDFHRATLEHCQLPTKAAR